MDNKITFQYKVLQLQPLILIPPPAGGGPAPGDVSFLADPSPEGVPFPPVLPERRGPCPSASWDVSPANKDVMNSNFPPLF